MIVLLLYQNSKAIKKTVEPLKYLIMKKSLLSIKILTLLSAGYLAAQAPKIQPDIAIKKLQEGNDRFVKGTSIRPNQDLKRLKQVSEGQNPFAIIVGCSDSRVPNEIIFDQGLGDLFIVRTAGQVSSYASWGSIEFAHLVLGAKLIVVLGHTKCGAVTAAYKIPDVPGHIVTLINSIKPAAEEAKKHGGDQIENAVKINVAMQVEQLKNLEPVLTKAVKNNDLKIVGAVYDLETGKVEYIPENFLSTLK